MIELEEYFIGILDGKINACDKMKKVSDMLMEKYYSPDEFHFDYAIANRHIEFIETWSPSSTPVIPEGTFAGCIRFCG